MTQSKQPNYITAGLHISNGGEITDIEAQGQKPVRLSPVNKKVLLTLLAHAGEAVSRQQLFDTVWPNQVISDDALTRCVSDLRAQLKSSHPGETLIQTIPKVGYRWLPAVTTTTSKVSQTAQPQRWQLHLKSAVLALMVLWLVVGLVYWWSKPAVVPLVILETVYSDQYPVDVTVQLKRSALQHEHLQYLSQHALDAHEGSPFPYFSHEFGVRWFIASHLTIDNAQTALTLDLIDAKTALVIYSETKSAVDLPEIQQHCQSFMRFVAAL